MLLCQCREWFKTGLWSDDNTPLFERPRASLSHFFLITYRNTASLLPIVIYTLMAVLLDIFFLADWSWIQDAFTALFNKAVCLWHVHQTRSVCTSLLCLVRRHTLYVARALAFMWMLIACISISFFDNIDHTKLKLKTFLSICQKMGHKWNSW